MRFLRGFRCKLMNVINICVGEEARIIGFELGNELLLLFDVYRLNVHAIHNNTVSWDDDASKR